MYIQFLKGSYVPIAPFDNGITGPSFGPCSIGFSLGKLHLSEPGEERTEFIPIHDEAIHERFAVIGGVYYAGFAYTQDKPDNAQPVTAFFEMIEAIREFTPHGTYCISNAGGYEVEISSDGDSARLRMNGHEPAATVTEWLPIEYVENEDSENEDDTFHPVIDPDGHNVPLSLVMRIN